MKKIRPTQLIFHPNFAPLQDADELGDWRDSYVQDPRISQHFWVVRDTGDENVFGSDSDGLYAGKEAAKKVLDRAENK